MANIYKVIIYWLKFTKRKIIYPKPLKCWKIRHSKQQCWILMKMLKRFKLNIWCEFLSCFAIISARITTENIDILTEIGILYLRINDTKGAFDKLFEVTKSHENCSKALLALGSILQVLDTHLSSTQLEININLLLSFCIEHTHTNLLLCCWLLHSQKMMSMVHSTSTSSSIRKVKKVLKYGTMSGCVFIKRRNL